MPDRYHRLTLRIPPTAYQRLRQRALVSGLGLGEEGRQAFDRGLAEPSPEVTPGKPSRLDQIELTAVAALVAVEQLTGFLLKYYPDGDQQLLEVAELAVEKAEDRLADLKERFREAAR